MEIRFEIRRILIVLLKLVCSLLCAVLLSYTAVYAGQVYTLPEQSNQFDILLEQAQSGSVEAQIKLGLPATVVVEGIAAETAPVGSTLDSPGGTEPQHHHLVAVGGAIETR